MIARSTDHDKRDARIKVLSCEKKSCVRFVKRVCENIFQSINGNFRGPRAARLLRQAAIYLV